MRRSNPLAEFRLWAGPLACLFVWGCAPDITTKAQTSSDRAAEQSDILINNPEANMCRSRMLPIREANTKLQRSATPNAATQVQNTQIMDHSHIPVAVPDGAPVPHMTITLTPDVMSGYNLSIKTENYTFMPPPFKGQTMEMLMEPVIDPATGFVQGHAHLYINGVKIQRIYGENIHLPESLFKNGVNQLNVTINNHAHMFWTYEDKEIISSLFINSNAPKLVLHQFDRFPVEQK